MPKEPLTARLLTTEMLIWSACTIFLFGGGYTALAKDNEASQDAISAIEQGQKAVVTDIASIKISVAVIAAKQAAGRVVSQDRFRRQEKQIDRVLNILEGSRNGRHP